MTAFTSLRGHHAMEPVHPVLPPEDSAMKYKTLARIGLLTLACGVLGCSGSDSSLTPLAPSPVIPQATTPPAAGGSWLSGHALTGVSLSGVVYELTPAGPVPIGGAVVYCELCSEETHSFATADANGYYHFSGDLSAGGGVWLVAGSPTQVNVGYNTEYQDPPGLPLQVRGPGWRDVLIDGDTRFDIELVRREPASP